MAGAGERSIEVKVGVLILVSLGVLAAFVLVMGGLSFEKTFPMYVDFDNPGGLQAGAPVRVAGVKVGKVDEMMFLGGTVDPLTGRRPLVRVRLQVQAKISPSLHEDAEFYVTTQGVLGEQYLAIEPGTPDKPRLEGSTTLPRSNADHGPIVKGIDPPRLDLFLAKAFDLLDTMVSAVHNNKEMIGDMATNAAGLLKGMNGLVSGNKDRIDRMLGNVDALISETQQLTHGARVNYVDNPKIARTLDNLDRIAADVQKDSGPLLRDAKESLANVNRITGTVGTVEEQKKLRKSIDDVMELASRANAAAADAQEIVAHIKKGSGSVGALVMDEEVYDDLQEMVRDLKHNPWKLFWRE